MKLYIARHGKSNYNDLGLCNADPSIDVHLTPTGIEQAEKLAEKLRYVPIERIFASELKRTQQTAERVNAYHNVAVEIDGRLNDGRSGFEGKSTELLDEALAAADNYWTARFNDGESIEDIKSRVAGFIEDLRAKPYQTVLIVTSQWIVFALLALLEKLPNEEAWNLEVPPGSYQEVEI